MLFNNKAYKRNKHTGFGSFVAISICAILIIISLIMSSVNTIVNYSKHDATTNTLPEDAIVSEIGYYTDEKGWIKNEDELLAGMKQFQSVTGVHPYLYIADNYHYLNQISADNLYNKLFINANKEIDEAYLLLIFMEVNGQYKTNIVCGDKAKLVIVEQDEDQLLSCIDSLYQDELSDEEYFSEVFAMLAITKLNKQTDVSPVKTILVSMGSAALVIALWVFEFKRYRKKTAQYDQMVEAGTLPMSLTEQMKQDAEETIQRVNNLMK